MFRKKGVFMMKTITVLVLLCVSQIAGAFECLGQKRAVENGTEKVETIKLQNNDTYGADEKKIGDIGTQIEQ